MQYLWLLCLIFSHVQAQDPTTTSPQWNGDPKICTVDTSTTPDGRPLPQFRSQAEFAFERVVTPYYGGVNPPIQFDFFEYIYDYNANKMIVIKDDNNIKEVNYFYYEILKKSTYYQDKFCVVTDIPVNMDNDGNSAIQLPDGTWHIRPLNELLLFSNLDPNRTIVRPTYIGQSVVRGIPVDQWKACIIDQTTYRTELRTWSFAQSSVNMPIGTTENMPVPIQFIVNASFSINGTEIAESDEVYNLISYRPGISEDTISLSPPKGVFCQSPDAGQNYVSLNDLNIFWPSRFGVRIDASSSRSSTWQSFHLQVIQNSTRKRIRYDFSPTGGENYRAVILDYKDNLTYSIDRRLGSCKITGGTESPDVDPLTKPIEFFIKHELRFLDEPYPKVWEFNGYRRCRGSAIMCTIVTSRLDQFPPIIDSDSGRPTGEVWDSTDIEYAWSVRAPSNPARVFDYPVHLFMRMQRFKGTGVFNVENIQTEDVEYEFYEISDDVHLNDFDTSVCYRSLDLPYRQLGFVLDIVSDNSLDNNQIDRHLLERNLVYYLVNGLNVNEARISKVELEHIRYENAFYVLFTLLGAPINAVDEPSIETAEVNLRKFISDGLLNFTTPLSSGGSREVQLMAQPNSLKSFEQFVSIHAGTTYANLSNCSVTPTTATTMTAPTTTMAMTTTSGSTVTPTVSNCTVPPVNNFNYTIERIIEGKYSASAEAGGIVGGVLVGIVVGLVIMLAIGFLRRNSTAKSTNGRISVENRRFQNSTTSPAIQMADLNRIKGATDT